MGVGANKSRDDGITDQVEEGDATHGGDARKVDTLCMIGSNWSDQQRCNVGDDGSIMHRIHPPKWSNLNSCRPP
jgi:hypothetical protein